MNNSKETNHTGYISFRGDRHFAYDLVDGIMTIHAFDHISELDNLNVIYAEGHDKKKYLMYSQMPFSLSEHNFYPIEYKHEVDWIIKDYQMGSMFHQARFCFPELNYFCPSQSIVKVLENEVVFSRERKTLNEFDITIQSINCHVSFIALSDGQYGLANSNMRAFSQLIVEFPETDDLIFIEALYHVVDSVFAFLCNRRNIGCLSMELHGHYMAKDIKNGKIIEVRRLYHSTVFFFDKYRDEPERKDIISKAYYSAVVFPHIKELFDLVADDVSDNQNKSANISISSMHPSLMRRGLIDLQQSLHITAAFEFYVRRYLPGMIEEKDYHQILKMILLEFADKKVGKKAKKHAKTLAENVIHELSLSEKIEKVYSGYHDWTGVEKCLEEDWFSKDVSSLAKAANEWRNELAHEKRSYEPNVETIRAIRLVEHLNYIIVLRQLGCDDQEIKEFLANVLVR